MKAITGDCGVCILAGGGSRRMGRDKARVLLGRRTMLGHARRAAGQTGLPVRVIRRDAVKRCGPLGGILTGLATSRVTAEVFMACDMPFVSSELLLELLARFRRTGKAVFVTSGHGCGFPCLVPVAMEGLVAALIGRGEWALQDLVATLPSERLRVRRGRALVELMNVNTTAELAAARERLRTTSETQV